MKPLFRAMAMAAALTATALSAQADDTDPAWLSQINELVRIETWRNPGAEDEAEREATTRKNIATIESKVKGWIDGFVAEKGLQNHVPAHFSWKSDDQKYWVFGWRVGKGKRKIALLTHMDTVPPGDVSDWEHDPFDPTIVTRTYKGKDTRFLAGRGTIDDKGPAVVTMHAMLEAIEELESDPDALNNITFELIFDTSEETDFSTTKYFDANPSEGENLALGIVYDAFWCIRAEKGIERPVFTFAKRDTPTDGLWIASFKSASGPANQIPGGATAIIDGADPDALAAFAQEVAAYYNNYAFDDPEYNAAALTVSQNDQGQVVLTTKVAGAQHGSAPQENRAKGANPLVSLGYFLSHLVENQTLGANHYSDVADFMRFGWGTQVFGEPHPDLLYRYDSVFHKDNGTTYALSQVRETEGGDLTLAMDIRYAIGHHATPWDGGQGQIDGSSLFGGIFDTLTQRFSQKHTEAGVSVTTTTLAGPDIRNPDNPYLGTVNTAYQNAMNQSCPMQAIGGGTDAKGRVELVAAGALFTDSLGPPINFHGIDEGAPIEDLVNGKKILKALLLNAAAGK